MEFQNYPLAGLLNLMYKLEFGIYNLQATFNLDGAWFEAIILETTQ